MKLSLNKNILIALNNLTVKYSKVLFHAIYKLTTKLVTAQYNETIPYNIHSNFIYSALNKLVKNGYVKKHVYKNANNKFSITSDGIDFLRRANSKLSKPVLKPVKPIEDGKKTKLELIDYTIKSKKITVKIPSNIVETIVKVLVNNGNGNGLKTGQIAYHLITDYNYTISQSLLKKVVNSIVYKTANKAYFFKDKITNRVVLSQ